MEKTPSDPPRLPHTAEVIPAADPRVLEVTKQIEAYYRQIPIELRSLPDMQERCLQHLQEAEQTMNPPVVRPQLIHTRLLLARVQIELARATVTRTAFLALAGVIYAAGAALGLLLQFGALGSSLTAQELNQQLVLGVPRPILLWAIIGTFSGMLMRAGHFPFADRGEALRWMLLRPVVGVVTGVLMYLAVIAGLLVFVGASEPKTPELLWIIAFTGGFSDTLSVGLLQKLLGRFRPVDLSFRRRPAEEPASVVSLPTLRLGQRDGAGNRGS
jgi:hypothetical protein